MSEREAFVNEKIETINNMIANAFLTEEARAELLRERSLFEVELEQIKMEKQIQAEQEQAAQLRIQAQGIKVESIELPHDFSTIFDDPRANEIIIEVVKNFQRQANAESNAEIEVLITRHREQMESERNRHHDELRAAADRELQLKRQNDNLQTDIETVQGQAEEMSKEVFQLNLELKEAESKRDAAMAKVDGLEVLLAEKQEHIDRLRDEAAIGASRAINVTSIESSERLSQLMEESKAAKIKSAVQIALENTVPTRGKVEIAVAPSALEVPTFLQTAGNVPFELGQESPVVEQFRENFGCELAGWNASGEMAAEENMGAATIEERVAALEAHVFGFVKGVAS